MENQNSTVHHEEMTDVEAEKESIGVSANMYGERRIKTIEELEENLKRLQLENKILEESDRYKERLQPKVSKSNWLNEFFWWCAGVDKEIIRQYPDEYAKFACMGATIFFTALMALLSGGYAISSVFHDTTIGALGCNKIGALFGLFWGALIFNLDRFMVTSMKYKDSLLKKVLMLSPRLLIAVFIGLVISVPVEMKIFDDKIQGQIRIDQAKDQAKVDEKYEIQLEPINTEINGLQKEIAEESNKLETLRKAVEDKRTELNEEINGKGGSGRPGYGPNAKRIDEQLKKQEESYNEIKENVRKNNELRDTRLTDLYAQRTAIEERRRVPTSVRAGFTERFLALMEVTERKAEDNGDNYLFYARLAIMFLFITIEIVPTLFKIMMSSGKYEEKMIELSESHHYAMQKNIDIIRNSSIVECQIAQANNQRRLEAELRANEDVMNKIADTQSELIKTSIALWREEELKKIKENPTIYLKQNNEKG